MITTNFHLLAAALPRILYEGVSRNLPACINLNDSLSSPFARPRAIIMFQIWQVNSCLGSSRLVGSAWREFHEFCIITCYYGDK